MRNPRPALTLLVAPALVLGLAACGPLDEPTLTDTTQSAEAEVKADNAAAEPKDDGVGEFGQKISWDGVDMVVSEPKPFEPSQTAAGVGEHNVSFDVKLTNTGTEPYDPVLVTITASSAETEAEQIFDMESGLEMGPTTQVRPGKSVNWTVAFSVADPADVQIDVTPDFTMQSVLLSTDG